MASKPMQASKSTRECARIILSLCPAPHSTSGMDRTPTTKPSLAVTAAQSLRPNSQGVLALPPARLDFSGV